MQSDLIHVKRVFIISMLNITRWMFRYFRIVCGFRQLLRYGVDCWECMGRLDLLVIIDVFLIKVCYY